MDAGGMQDGCGRDAGCRMDAGCAAPALPGGAVLPLELPGAVGRIGTAGRLCSRPFPAFPRLSRPFPAFPGLSWPFLALPRPRSPAAPAGLGQSSAAPPPSQPGLGFLPFFRSSFSSAHGRLEKSEMILIKCFLHRNKRALFVRGAKAADLITKDKSKYLSGNKGCPRLLAAGEIFLSLPVKMFNS